MEEVPSAESSEIISRKDFQFNERLWSSHECPVIFTTDVQPAAIMTNVPDFDSLPPVMDMPQGAPLMKRPSMLKGGIDL